MTFEDVVRRMATADRLTVAAADAMRPPELTERTARLWREVVLDLVARYPWRPGDDYLDLRWNVIYNAALSVMSERLFEKYGCELDEKAVSQAGGSGNKETS